MLYGLLLALYVVTCFLLILLVLIQKGKSSLGIGTIGGGNQMLFGGSGGQDVFQKATWVLGAIFMLGSFVLAVITSNNAQSLDYEVTRPVAAQVHQKVPANTAK